MGRIAIRAGLLSVLVLTLSLALAACTSDSKKAEPEPNIVPTNYKQEIIDTLSRVLDDPTNVRDAFISEPVLRPAGKDERYTVCVRANARNLSRHYSGAKDRIGYFYGGHLNQLVDASKEQCGNALYKPFPELEKLCLGSKCE
jgi:ABC-type Fe3+-hydroxamate transport system substrate-binding protein